MKRDAALGGGFGLMRTIMAGLARRPERPPQQARRKTLRLPRASKRRAKKSSLAAMPAPIGCANSCLSPCLGKSSTHAASVSS
jgi:hypothetical protein